MTPVGSRVRPSGLHTVSSRPVVAPSGATASTTGAVGPAAPTPARVVVCHSASLAGRAIAAALHDGVRLDVIAVVDSATALLRATSQRWDVALVSDTLGGEIAELCEALAHRGVRMPVVVMSSDDSPEVAAKYLEGGAAGVVDVRRPVASLHDATRIAAEGRPVLDERSVGRILAALRERAEHREHARTVMASLSPRERRVIGSLSRGTGVADIAASLHLSPHTIRACIRTLGPRLGVAGQLQLAAVARELLAAMQEPVPSPYLRAVCMQFPSVLPLSG